MHLRELNTLLNNDDAINKPIIFIYAVKDDIFVGNDRTKFFDFIIPVVPIINSTNSSEILLQKINPNSGFPQFQGILQETVFDVAPFISDMRTLQNICNEFIVYKNTLANELSLSEDKMFAIMAFKNLYPKDFSDLQNESGVVKEAFSDKQKFIYAQSEVLQHKIEHAEELLKKVHSDVLQNSNEVKFSMLISLAGSNQIVTRIYSYSSSFDVDYSRIMTDSFDLLALKKVKQCRIECRQIFHILIIPIVPKKKLMICPRWCQIMLIDGKHSTKRKHKVTKSSNLILKPANCNKKSFETVFKKFDKLLLSNRCPVFSSLR